MEKDTVIESSYNSEISLEDILISLINNTPDYTEFVQMLTEEILINTEGASNE